jgi:hypothetical protein
VAYPPGPGPDGPGIKRGPQMEAAGFQPGQDPGPGPWIEKAIFFSDHSLAPKKRPLAPSVFGSTKTMLSKVNGAKVLFLLDFLFKER